MMLIITVPLTSLEFVGEEETGGYCAVMDCKTKGCSGVEADTEADTEDDELCA